MFNLHHNECATPSYLRRQVSISLALLVFRFSVNTRIGSPIKALRASGMTVGWLHAAGGIIVGGRLRAIL